MRVKGASQQLSDLARAVKGVGPGKSLANKVKFIQSSLAAKDTSNACGTLNAFIHEVQAQTGKKIKAGTAANLITEAQRIEAVIPCNEPAGVSPAGIRHDAHFPFRSDAT